MIHSTKALGGRSRLGGQDRVVNSRKEQRKLTGAGKQSASESTMVVESTMMAGSSMKHGKAVTVENNAEKKFEEEEDDIEAVNQDGEVFVIWNDTEEEKPAEEKQSSPESTMMAGSAIMVKSSVIKAKGEFDDDQEESIHDGELEREEEKLDEPAERIPDDDASKKTWIEKEEENSLALVEKALDEEFEFKND